MVVVMTVVQNQENEERGFCCCYIKPGKQPIILEYLKILNFDSVWGLGPEIENKNGPLGLKRKYNQN